MQSEWAELAASLNDDGDDDGPPSDPTPPHKHEDAAEFAASLDNVHELDAELNSIVDELACDTDFKKLIDTELTHFSEKDKVSDDLQAQFCSNCVRADGGKVRLNDTNAEVRPRVMAFESDTLSIEEQEDNIKSSAWAAKVFSGNKSLHVLVEVPDAISQELSKISVCDRVAVWHRMYKTVAEMLFKDTSSLDMACKSWLRKFRTPNGIRSNGAVQRATFNSSITPLSWRGILDFAVEC